MPCLEQDLISPNSSLEIWPSEATASPWGNGLGLGGHFSFGPPSIGSEVLPWSLVPSNIHPNIADERVDELLQLIQPNELANTYRNRIVQFISRHVKRTLGATCFCVGSFAQRCYLPDEEILLSAFLCNGQESTWFIRVNEALCKAKSVCAEPLYK